MKRFFYLLLISLGFAALTACSDDDKEEPTASTPDKKLVSKIVVTSEDYSEEEEENSEMTFEYDTQNRLVSMTGSTTGEDAYNIKETFTYSENTITTLSVWTAIEEEYTSEETGVYTLNKDGYVGTWKQEEDGEVSEGKITYDANGYFLSSEIWDAEESRNKSEERAEWKDGNLVKVIGSGENAFTTLEYGELPNNANLDFTYLFAGSEWMSCLAFGGSGIKPFGYFGKRSANLPVKESDSEEDTYYLYQYESDSEGNIVKVTVTGYDNTSKEAESVTVYTISYINAQ